jgi:hypothetical protein
MGATAVFWASEFKSGTSLAEAGFQVRFPLSGPGRIEGDEVPVGLDAEPGRLCIRILYSVSITSLWLACSNERVLGKGPGHGRCSKTTDGSD